jgi:hypothetical protein
MGSELVVSDFKNVRHRTGNIETCYQIADKDVALSTHYYGYVNNEGGWLIMEEGATAYKYAVGWSDYETAWAGRAGLTYKYWHKLGDQI